MKKAIMAALTLAVGLATLGVMPAGAVPFDGRPKIMLHVKALTTKNACTTWGSLADCQQAVITGDLTPPGGPGYYYIYLLVVKGSELDIAGLQCGITYENNAANGASDGIGLDIFTWTLCATLQFAMPTPVWPNPGGGNLITWDRTTVCQTGETAVAGYFYSAAYGQDKFGITVRPADGKAKVADCSAAEFELLPTDLGYVAFSTGQSVAGCNPCLQSCPPVAVQTTTWSGVKTLYKR